MTIVESRPYQTVTVLVDPPDTPRTNSMAKTRALLDMMLTLVQHDNDDDASSPIDAVVKHKPKEEKQGNNGVNNNFGIPLATIYLVSAHATTTTTKRRHRHDSRLASLTTAFLEAMSIEEEQSTNNTEQQQQDYFASRFTIMQTLLHMRHQLHGGTSPQLSSSRLVDLDERIQLLPTNVKKRKRALLIGINYNTTSGNNNDQSKQQSGSHTNVRHVKHHLLQTDGFNNNTIQVLMDTRRNIKQSSEIPSRSNILKALDKLANAPGDFILLYFAGHAAADGSGLLPFDYQDAGVISELDLQKHLFQRLPQGTQVTVVLDCPSSALQLDTWLPYKLVCDDDDAVTAAKQNAQVKAHVKILSVGCKNGGGGDLVMGGGMVTSAFLAAISLANRTKMGRLSWIQLLDDMRTCILGDDNPQQEQLQQVLPQLTCSRILHLEDQVEIVPSTGGGTTKRALLIGIEYRGTTNNHELNGCHDGVKRIQQHLHETRAHGIVETNVHVLMDDNSDLYELPTRENLLQAFRRLVMQTKPGDFALVLYSGHGGGHVVGDTTLLLSKGVRQGDNTTVMVPLDFETQGVIGASDLMHELLEPMPQGATITLLLDCCQTCSSLLNLPYEYVAHTTTTANPVAPMNKGASKGMEASRQQLDHHSNLTQQQQAHSIIDESPSSIRSFLGPYWATSSGGRSSAIPTATLQASFSSTSTMGNFIQGTLAGLQEETAAVTPSDKSTNGKTS